MGYFQLTSTIYCVTSGIWIKKWLNSLNENGMLEGGSDLIGSNFNRLQNSPEFLPEFKIWMAIEVFSVQREICSHHLTNCEGDASY